MGPEVVLGLPYNEVVDMWAAGAVLWVAGVVLLAVVVV